MTILDAHSHILPAIDDGAVSVRQSVLLLNQLEKQSAEAVAFTPHFLPQKKKLAEFLRERDDAVGLLSPALLKKHPPIMLGAEVFLAQELFDNGDIGRLCFSGSYMLTELPTMTAWSDSITSMLHRLIGAYGIMPVIAHAERYANSKGAYDVMHRLVEKGCLIQMNADSLLWPFRRFMADRLCREGLVFLLGSDAHNTWFRPVRIRAAYEVVGERYPKIFEQVNHCADMIIKNANWAKKGGEEKRDAEDR